jgi:WD40 repeat protein
MSDLERRLVSAKPCALYGHTKKITSLAWAPTSSSSSSLLVASGSSDTTIRCWALDASGQSRRSDVLAGHEGAVDALAWCPLSAHVLASGATDRSVRLWDARSGGKCTAVVATKGQALSMAWTLDALGVVVGTRDDTLLFIDVRKASALGPGAGSGSGSSRGSGGSASAVVSSTQLREELNEFAFCPHNGLLYAGLGTIFGVTDEGSVGVFSVLRGAPEAGSGSSSSSSSAAAPAAPAAPAPSAASAAPAPSAASTAPAPSAPPAAGSGSFTGISELWRARCHTAPVTHLRFSCDGRHFATGSGDATVCLWDAAEGTVLRVFDRPEAQVRALSWSRDGGHLAIASGDSHDAAAARGLDIVRSSDGTRVCGVSGSVGLAAWSPSAHVLAYAAEDLSPAPGTLSSKPAGAAPAAGYEPGALRVLAA